ncbi:Uncharacterised protein [BD1-7 clade bacterium]|uniref:Mechanosensitive ion channel MscS domain-containing protein n=1 Tax=BD1-7 clade bacterium TaxID=2029982 RepID=A0A5S9R029_9GAMM|nr:Uncharacterised protein [BD1-7 clade bacterium]
MPEEVMLFFSSYKLIATVIVIVVIVVIRWLILSLFRHPRFSTRENRRLYANVVRNISNILILFSLASLWSAEIHQFALSIAAFAVALVLSMREYIQSLSGGVYRIVTSPFVIGDWVQIGSYTGEVTSTDLLSTTLFEVDVSHGHYGYTGKTLVLPNNLFLTNGVKNLNFMRRFLVHSFSITRKGHVMNPFEVKAYILERVQEYCAHFYEIGRRYNALIEKRLDITIQGPEPMIRVSTTDLGHNVFTVSIFCPTEEVHDIEQKVTEDFLRLWYERLDAQMAFGRTHTEHWTDPNQEDTRD